jgi:lipoate-protein ligase B
VAPDPANFAAPSAAGGGWSSQRLYNPPGITLAAPAAGRHPSHEFDMPIDWDNFTNQTPTVAEVRLLGLVDVPSVLALQKLMVHEVRQQSRLNAAVLLCEHPPAVTVGEGASLLELPESRRELESRLIQVHRVRRDGRAILHQPGQLAAYVVVSLPECSMSLAEFRSVLQQAVIRTAADVQVNAHARDDEPSAVFGRHGVIAELGIHEADGVTSFGVFLNVSPRLDEARQVGRGLAGQRISSLDAERVRPTPMPQVRSSLIRQLCDGLGYPDYHLHTGHPFLQRARVLVHDKFANPATSGD